MVSLSELASRLLVLKRRKLAKVCLRQEKTQFWGESTLLVGKRKQLLTEVIIPRSFAFSELCLQEKRTILRITRRFRPSALIEKDLLKT